jgi:hypothetical protein
MRGASKNQAFLRQAFFLIWRISIYENQFIDIAICAAQPFDCQLVSGMPIA